MAKKKKVQRLAGYKEVRVSFDPVDEATYRQARELGEQAGRQLVAMRADPGRREGRSRIVREGPAFEPEGLIGYVHVDQATPPPKPGPPRAAIPLGPLCTIDEAWPAGHEIAERSQDRASIPAGSLSMLFPEPIDDVAKARSLVRELLIGQALGHDRARALRGGCVCRWCRAWRFVEGA